MNARVLTLGVAEREAAGGDEAPGIAVARALRLHAADLAHAILDILRSGKWIPGIYHYSNEGIISWYDFAVEIKALTHSYCLVNPVGSESYPTPAQRPRYYAMNIDKIRQTYSVTIRNWKDSLAECFRKISA